MCQVSKQKNRSKQQKYNGVHKATVSTKSDVVALDGHSITWSVLRHIPVKCLAYSDVQYDY